MTNLELQDMLRKFPENAQVLTHDGLDVESVEPTTLDGDETFISIEPSPFTKTISAH